MYHPSYVATTTISEIAYFVNSVVVCRSTHTVMQLIRSTYFPKKKKDIEGKKKMTSRFVTIRASRNPVSFNWHCERAESDRTSAEMKSDST